MLQVCARCVGELFHTHTHTHAHTHCVRAPVISCVLCDCVRGPCARIHACVCLHVRAHVHLFALVCACVCIYFCARVCSCACACACVCVFARTESFGLSPTLPDWRPIFLPFPAVPFLDMVNVCAPLTEPGVCVLCYITYACVRACVRTCVGAGGCVEAWPDKLGCHQQGPRVLATNFVPHERGPTGTCTSVGNA